MIKRRYLWNAFFAGTSLMAMFFAWNAVIFSFAGLSVALNGFTVLKALGWLDPSH